MTTPLPQEEESEGSLEENLPSRVHRSVGVLEQAAPWGSTWLEQATHTCQSQDAPSPEEQMESVPLLPTV